MAPEVKKNGGLFTLFTFYSDNLRVEGQGFVRSGRQGQPGSCFMILDAEDEGIESLMRLNSDKRDLVMRLKKQLEDHLALQGENKSLLPYDPLCVFIEHHLSSYAQN